MPCDRRVHLGAVRQEHLGRGGSATDRPNFLFPLAHPHLLPIRAVATDLRKHLLGKPSDIGRVADEVDVGPLQPPGRAEAGGGVSGGRKRDPGRGGRPGAHLATSLAPCRLHSQASALTWLSSSSIGCCRACSTSKKLLGELRIGKRECRMSAGKNASCGPHEVRTT